MTTIIIHGTLGKDAQWHWGSWHKGGFCHAVAQGMQDAGKGRSHDIWRLNGIDVSQIERLQQAKWTLWTGAPKDLVSVNGRFEWSGAPEGLARGAAAIWLARYLNRLREITREPIRIIAHSHGCNIVKLASSLKELSPDVFIEKAAFIACPHFYETTYAAEKPKVWTDKFDITKQMLKEAGKRFRYKLDPKRFGAILNVYSEADDVQLKVAGTWSGTYAPQTGGFWDNLAGMLKTMDVYELPKASRTELDPDVKHLYQDVEVRVATGCGGLGAHSVLHGARVGRFIGQWLYSAGTKDDVIRTFGEIPAIPSDDVGE
jgi:hypothetical protein